MNKKLCGVSMVFILFVTSSSSQYTAKGRSPQSAITRDYNIVNSLQNYLKHEKWDDDEVPCYEAMIDLLEGVKNQTLWAVWVWDSMQPPAGTFFGNQYHLGNFDQCLQSWPSSPVPTQYCLVDVQMRKEKEAREFKGLEKAGDYLAASTKFSRDLTTLTFGVCLPSVCFPSSVAKISSHIHQHTHLPTGDVTVDPKDCQTAKKEYPMKFYAFWWTTGILFTFASISSIFTSFDHKNKYIDTITRPFCLKKNLYDMTKVSKDDIKVMNGMRFLTAAIVVNAHTAMFFLIAPVSNNLDMDKIINNSPFGRMVLHVEVVVDTFFLMSGLLLVRGLMSGRQKNLFLMMCKRYTRLIGPYAVVTIFYITAIRYTVSGPLWPRLISEEADYCDHSWWRNLLMTNTDVTTLCNVTFWSVSCDYQLAVMGACLFFLFKKNEILGISAFMAVTVAHLVYLGYVVYSKRLPILPFYNTQILCHMRKAHSLNYTYFKSYSRAGSYLVGMAQGYIMTKYQPRDFRNVIGKNWSIFINLASVTTMCAIISLGYIYSDREYNPAEAAVVAATNRMAWAVAVGCFICACEYGTVPIINDFMSWSGFVPLSKLSYGIYLVHAVFIMTDAFSTRGASKLDFYVIVLRAASALVFSTLTSLIMYLIIEAPLTNISNRLFTEKSKNMDQTGKKQENTDILQHSGVKEGTEGVIKTKIS